MPEPKFDPPNSFGFPKEKMRQLVITLTVIAIISIGMLIFAVTYVQMYGGDWLN